MEPTNNFQTPAVETPAVTPAAPAVQVVTPAVPAKKPQQQNGKKPGLKKGMIQIPPAAFKGRVSREAAMIVKNRLGVTLEEAERLVKAGPAATPQPGQSADAAALMKANETLRREAEKVKRSNQDLERKYKKDTGRLKDKLVEQELRTEAVKAGVIEVDYALFQFAKAAATGQVIDPAKYFADLKKTSPFLFSTPTTPTETPVEVPVTTAPPESLQPGGVLPTPVTPGSPTETDVDKLTPTEFNARLRSKYGYSS